MAHRERPYDDSERFDSYKFPHGGTRHVPPIDVNPADEEKRAVRVVDSYLLHHIRSDQVTPPQDRDLLFS